MTRSPTTEQDFGHGVLGPIVAEFCLRLWSLASLMDRPDDVALLFCARGGLRMQLAYERFLAATGLPSSAHLAPLMVSRVAAVRPSIQRTLDDHSETLSPAVTATLEQEFGRRAMSVAEVFGFVTGVAPSTPGPAWDETFTSARLLDLVRHADGAAGRAALADQARLFVRHVGEARAGKSTVVLVDTGLYGTTRALMAEGMPELDVGCALLARSYRPGAVRDPRTAGLSLDAFGYSPLHPRTAILRYWQYVEWLFEPALPSVRTFTVGGGAVQSNLEVPGWRERLDATPASAFTGVLDYLDGLPNGPADRVVAEGERAWRQLYRAVVWPRDHHGELLAVGDRSHDFGRDGMFGQRSFSSPFASLRGESMWREGEIARTGSAFRLPLLMAIEAAYSARKVARSVARWREAKHGGQLSHARPQDLPVAPAAELP